MLEISTNLELINEIEKGISSFKGTIFTKWINLRGKKFEMPMIFAHAYFTEKSINFDKCKFLAGLDMQGSCFDSTIELGEIYLRRSILRDDKLVLGIQFCNNAIIHLNKAEINTKVYFPNDFVGDVILDGAFLGERGQIFCGNNILLALKCFLYFGSKVHVNLDYKFDLGAFKELILSHCAK